MDKSMKKRKERLSVQLDVWKTARLYLDDNCALLTEHERKALAGLIRSRNPRALLSRVDELLGDYSSAPDRCRFLLQIRSFFKKNEDLRGEHCAEAAERNFHKAEALCRITNKRLDHFSKYPDRAPELVKECLPSMRAYIARVVGCVDDWLEEIPRLIRLTSGATASATRDRALPYLKMRRCYDVTKGCMPYVHAIVRYLTGGTPDMRIVNQNRVVLVAKNCDTDRTIAAEPIGNLPVQLTVDSWFKRCLRRVGIDLSNQGTNRELARRGVELNLATVDLSMASDTLALNTVLDLFPEDWSRVLMALRTPCWKGFGSFGTYAKFSSMGNGFTFTVETIVFAAMCQSLGSRCYSVYGDDIIIESHLTPKLLSLLQFYGFKMNVHKSFIDGPFRESCGAYFSHGQDVKPFFLKGEPVTQPDLCHALNGLFGVATYGGSLYLYLCELVRKEKLPLVPENECTRSGVFIHPYEAYRRGLIRNTAFGPAFRGLVEVPKSVLVPQLCDDAENDDTLRGRRWKQKRARLYWHFNACTKGRSTIGDDFICRWLRLEEPIISSVYSSTRLRVRKDWAIYKPIAPLKGVYWPTS